MGYQVKATAYRKGIGSWFKIAALFSAAAFSALGAAQPETVEFNTTFLRTQIDVEQFSRGNPVEPGVHRIELYVNDRWKGRKDVNFALPSPEEAIALPCYDLELLTILGMNTEKLDKKTLAALERGEICESLDVLVPGAEYEFDSGEQRLNIKAPQIVLLRQQRGYVNPALWDEGVTAGVLQYDYNAYHSEINSSGSQSSQYLGLRGGFNWGAWRVRYRGAFNWDDRQGLSYKNTSTYVERGIIPWRSKLVMGEATTDGQVFDSLGFQGIQLSSDDRMYADTQRGFAPIIRGIANTNALVRVEQRGTQIYETTVPPGPFVIDDLFPTGAGGDLQVTVREADGSEHRFSVPFSSVAELLRPGVTRYSVTAGRYNNSALSDEPLMAMGTLRHGFSNLITGYGGVMGADEYAAISGGVALNTQFGAFAADITHAQTTLPDRDTLKGESLRFTYSKVLPVVNTDLTLASYRYSDSGYYDAREAFLLQDRLSKDKQWSLENVQNRRNRLQFSATQSLPDGFGSFNVSVNMQDYWNRSSTDTEYQAGYNNAFKYFTFGVNANRTRNVTTDRWDDRIVFSISLPLGSSNYAPQLSTSYVQERHHSAVQSTLSGSMGSNRQVTYSAFANADHYHQSSSKFSGGATATWAAPYATAGGSYSKGHGYSQFGANLSGGIVAYQGGLVLTPSIGETIAVVEAKHAEGIKVSNNNSVRLDNKGRAAIPYISPYRLNTIELNPEGLSSDVELKSTSQNVVPTAGAVVVLRYETEKGNSLLFSGRTVQGDPLPFGASVTDERGNIVGYIAQGGQGFIRVNADKGRLRIEWGEKGSESCQVDYELFSLVNREGEDYRRFDAICR